MCEGMLEPHTLKVMKKMEVWGSLNNVEFKKNSYVLVGVYDHKVQTAGISVRNSLN